MTTSSQRVTLSQLAVCLAVFVACGLWIAWPSLDYDWHWDDLHIVRPFSASEIARSLTGTWDATEVETRGFRPLTVLFNDVRARAFGESVRAQRVFLILLFAVYLAWLTALVCRFGAPWRVGLAAGALTLCCKDSLYHVVWISDGIHLVPAVLFVAAAQLLLDFLDGGRPWLAAASGALLVGALVAREDSLVLYPAAVVMGLTYLVLFERPSDTYRRLGRYAVFLCLTFLLVWVWRLFAVPSAPNFRVNADVLLGPLRHMWWTIGLSGQGGAAPYFFLAGFLGVLAVAARLPRGERGASLMWLALAALTCLPGAVRARSNLLLFPVSFYAVFVTSTADSIARGSKTAAAMVVATLLIAAGVSARASRLEQLSVHPRSADKLYRDWQSIYSSIHFPDIPRVREERVKANLARYGIVDARFDFDAWQSRLRQQGRVGFINDDDAFIPERYFLTP